MKKLVYLNLICLMLVPASAQEEQSVTLEDGVAGELVLEWPGVLYRTYFLRHSTDLANWTHYPDVIEQGEGLEIGWTFMPDYLVNRNFFLQLNYTDIPAAVPEMADFDGDNVASIYEISILPITDPLDPETDGTPDGEDTDNDGLPDFLEVHFFGSTDLTLQSGDGDADLDGLTNKEEFELTTDPNVDESASAGARANYIYDLNGRLTNATSPQGSITYVYDEEGNIDSAQ